MTNPPITQLPVLTPGSYTMRLAAIQVPKEKRSAFLLRHDFGLDGHLMTWPAWLYFSNKEALQAYLGVAGASIGKDYLVDVKLKEEKVGNRIFSWNTIHPWWGMPVVETTQVTETSNV